MRNESLNKLEIEEEKIKLCKNKKFDEFALNVKFTHNCVVDAEA